MTLEQEQRGGGIAVPINAAEEAVATPQSAIDIGLGSAFAVELGFPPSIQPYVETADASPAVASSQQNGSSPSNKKKNKKSNKKGKKKK